MTTLSGGEAQRIRLASQLSTGLTGVIYVLDEPSVGMHPQDIGKLIETLTLLRNLGNTVIVVEHDAEIMAAADFVIDVGPGAGVYGGEIIASGTLDELKKDKNSTTGQYLSGKQSIEVPKKLHKGSGKHLEVVGATQHNLDNVDLKIPLGKFVAVSGVSGSGKSTLVLDILGTFLSKHFYRAKKDPGEHKAVKGLKHIDKVISIDQSPIGRTPRSILRPTLDCLLSFVICLLKFLRQKLVDMMPESFHLMFVVVGVVRHVLVKDTFVFRCNF